MKKIMQSLWHTHVFHWWLLSERWGSCSWRSFFPLIFHRHEIYCKIISDISCFMNFRVNPKSRFSNCGLLFTVLTHNYYYREEFSRIIFLPPWSYYWIAQILIDFIFFPLVSGEHNDDSVAEWFFLQLTISISNMQLKLILLIPLILQCFCNE